MRKKAVVIIAFLVSVAFCGTAFAAFYRYNVDDLAKKARKKIEEIDKKIEAEEVKQELKNVLTELQGLFEKAEALFSQGKYNEAAKIYAEIKEIRDKKEVKETLEKAAKH